MVNIRDMSPGERRAWKIARRNDPTRPKNTIEYESMTHGQKMAATKQWEQEQAEKRRVAKETAAQDQSAPAKERSQIPVSSSPGALPTTAASGNPSPAHPKEATEAHNTNVETDTHTSDQQEQIIATHKQSTSTYTSEYMLSSSTEPHAQAQDGQAALDDADGRPVAGLSINPTTYRMHMYSTIPEATAMPSQGSSLTSPIELKDESDEEDAITSATRVKPEPDSAEEEVSIAEVRRLIAEGHRLIAEACRLNAEAVRKLDVLEQRQREEYSEGHKRRRLS